MLMSDVIGREEVQNIDASGGRLVFLSEKLVVNFWT